jgi:ABC-type transport system involved in multi-copper enzyme maturation permease subunit
VDFLLVKPISRPALLVYKYCGGLTFVFLNAGVLVFGTWVAFGITTGNWSPWYLTSIFVVTFYFAILYSFSVLMGVLTRSPMAAVLLTLVVWFLLFAVNQAFLIIHLPMFEKNIQENAPAVLLVIDVVHFVLPKPSALGILNQSLLLRANGSEDFLLLQDEAMARFSWTETVTTSLAFIVVMLGLASWRFSRRDY